MVQRLPFLPVLVASAIVLLALTVAYYPPRRRLLASASTDRSAYVPGESVNISITLLAKGTAPITLRID